MSREATIEQSSLREAAGYDQVFQIGHEPEEGISWLLKRETSTLSPDEEVESCVVKGGEEEEINEGEDEGDDGEEDDGDKGDPDKRTLEGGSSKSLGDGHTHPFILPKCGPSMISCRR